MENYTKFDRENLQGKVEPSRTKRILQKLLTFFVSLFFLTLIMYIIAAYFLETPEQRLLEDQARRLEQEYQRQYEQYKQLEEAVNRLRELDRNIYRVIFEAEPPIEEPLTNFDTLEQLKVRQIIRWNTDDINAELEQWTQMLPQYKELFDYVEQNSSQIHNIPGIQPVPNSGLRFVVYGYGRKIDPVYKTPSFHPGVDFSAPGGTPVFATANGTVVEANQRIRGLGLHVKIDHGNGFSTLYAHMSELSVRRGEKVQQGQIIGYVGNTGKALLPHLHYEVQYKGHPINPIYFFFLELSPQQFFKLQKEADRSGISLD